MNITSTRASIERAALGIPRNTRNVGFAIGTRGITSPRDAEWPTSSTIERLVLVGGSAEGRVALEKRAELIAGDMTARPRIVKAEDDPSAMIKASDLVLVNRKKPLPFVVPYLGRAERRLLRDSRAPVLVVAGMPHASYRRVLVASDLHTDAGEALAAAKRIAPNASITLLHVYRALFDGKLQWAGVPETDIAKYRTDAQREAALGMANVLSRHPAVEPHHALLRYGWPVPVLLRTAGEIDADLIVIVRNKRSWWTEAAGASVSLELAQRAERDVLVVCAPPA